MDTDKLSPSHTSLACLEHAHIHTECISSLFTYSASLMSVEIILCSVPQENELSAGFTLYQQFIHRSILFTSLSLSYFFFTDLSPSLPLSILCQVRKGLIVPLFDIGQAPMPQRSRLHSACPELRNLSCLQDQRF